MYQIDHCHVIHVLQDINQVNTHADEMDLFTMVSRRFKKVFSKQEQMRTFPIYDASIEVSHLKEVIDCASEIYRIMHPRLGRSHLVREKKRRKSFAFL